MILDIIDALVSALGVFTAIVILVGGAHRCRGAIAWIMSLLFIPWIATPLYWLSGQVRYGSYRDSRERTRRALEPVLGDLIPATARVRVDSAGDSADSRPSSERVFRAFAAIAPSTGNRLTLLPRSEKVFDQILADIDRAEHYVLLQSYLFRDDEIGIKVGDHLIAAKRRGCEVRVLFDELGSYEASDSFYVGLGKEGVSVESFTKRRRLLPRFRMNYRNHRKIVVIDGRVGYAGGLNIGDEYLDGADEFEDWRDTHLRIHGAAALELQLCFIEDWQFATKERQPASPSWLRWSADSAEVSDQGAKVTVCPIGPHTTVLSGDILVTQLIECAQRRLWIASPYFLPDDRVIASLKAAALRGVDLRIVVPRESDHAVIGVAHRAFFEELTRYGIRFYLFENGFMHQKVMLMDDRMASIGSANFDNRSFRLNFEVLCIVEDREFAGRVSSMLEDDFTSSTEVRVDENEQVGWTERVMRSCARLLSPVM